MSKADVGIVGLVLGFATCMAVMLYFTEAI